jgi:molybdopterin converting factor small subunit
MPTLKIPTPLRPYADGQSTLTLPGKIVEDVLEGAVAAYPMLRKHLFNDEGKLRPFVNLFLGEDNVNQLEGLKTPLSDGDTLMIIPSIAGG